jgi:hypothetical protein
MPRKDRNTKTPLTGKEVPASAEILAESLSGSDDELGALLLGIFIQTQAQALGIPTDKISDAFGEIVVERVKTLQANSAGLTALEKALHFAAEGNFETSGRFLREHMMDGAKRVNLEKLAKTYVPIGIRKVEQSREFGQRGGAEKREEGRTNRDNVLAAARSIIENRKSSRRPSVRELTPAIARTTNLSESTVRRHLTKKELNKLLD